MTSFAQWLISIIEQLIQFILDLPLIIGEWFWQGLLYLVSNSKIVPLIEASGDLFSNIDPGVWYFLNLMHLPYGLTMVTGAYVLRFLVRRIPFVG
ncbi:DUF2523 family protein [Pseudomonas putida]|uniref:DUF2523 family protein n=1 Tax=Pseudomonas putida TaxID=303 RepID=UPI002271D898|nr:DUF2523 family protein [Pseudomonas putida]WAB95621.1 DUF2523 family protein [Pseudomonas putida]WAB95632.1 DUF2523 family protein [Pseudomonas putida]